MILQQMLDDQIELAEKLKKINYKFEEAPRKINEYLESSKALSLTISNIYELKRILWSYNFMTEEWINKSERTESEKLNFNGGEEPKSIPEEIKSFEVIDNDGTTILKIKDTKLEVLKGYTVRVKVDKK